MFEAFTQNNLVKGHIEYLSSQSWPTSRQEMLKALEKALNKKTKTILLNEASHGRFLAPIHDMAEIIGMTYKPAVFVVDKFPHMPAAYRKLPNAAGNPLLGCIMINPSIMKLFDSHPSCIPPVKMQGVMAHELSHIHYDLASILTTHFGPMLAPLAGVAGLWLYDRAHNKKKIIENALSANDIKQMNKDIHTLAEEEKKRIDQETPKVGTWHIDPAWQKAAIDVGRYVTIAALSYVGAMALCRSLSLNREYAADRLAVELTGNPEAYKQMLGDLSSAYRKIGKDIAEATTFKDKFERTFKRFQSMTNHAHPKTSQRIAAIDSYAEKLGLARAAEAGLHLGH